MYGYIYISTNNVNGMKYIGQKQGEFNVSYLGSGVLLKQAIKIYGRKSFSVNLIAYAKSREELNYLERLIIERNDAVRSKMFYNLSVGGDAWGSPLCEETKKKISIATTGRVAHNKGVPNLIAKARMLSNNPMKNPEIAKRVSEARIGKPAHNRKDPVPVVCELCKNKFYVKRKFIKRRFCGKSCAAIFVNNRRWIRVKEKSCHLLT